jgi:hypothetical protein
MAWWQFWKRDEGEDLASLEKELGLGSSDRLGLEMRSEPVEESFDKLNRPEQFGGPSPERSLYENQKQIQAQQMQQMTQNTDIQLISAKLDTIKAMLEAMNQRLITLEKHVEEKNKQKLW